MLSTRSHSIIKISMYQHHTSQMSNLVIIDCCGFKVEEEDKGRKGYLDFSLKQVQDFLLEYANNQNINDFKTDLDRKTKIVRVMASIFLSNYKMFILSPILMHKEPEVNKYLLDMIEGLGNSGSMLEASPPIPKKDAKFVYFSVFNMKNQSSRLFMKKGKLGANLSKLEKTLDKSMEKGILSDNDAIVMLSK